MYKTSLLCNVFYLICSLSDCFECKETDVVYTKAGAVQGKWLTSRKLPLDNSDVTGKMYTFASFQGIKYAEPPIGKLRFREPLALRPWSGVVKAFNSGSQCVQQNGKGSEDCLFLNVYTPSLPSNNASDEKTLYPVLFFIHGGSFTQGNSSFDFYGPDFLIQENIVIVTINYRLGAAGFLSTEDISAPGNAGLKDQLLALNWVQRNIKYFSGNPRKVTLYGWSAGSMSVHLHVLSSSSKGLFHQAISQSGSALFYPTVPLDSRATAFQLGHVLGINATTSKDLVNKLRNVSIHDIAKVELSYAPVVEASDSSPTPFLTRTPREIASSGNFNRVPYMIGTTLGENVILKSAIENKSSADTELKNIYDMLAESAVYEINSSSSQQDDVKNDVKQYFFGEEEISVNTIPQLANLATDIIMAYPTYKTVQMQSKFQKIYLYQFSFFGNYNFAGENFNQLLKEYNKPAINLPYHEDDICYLWRHIPDDLNNINRSEYSPQTKNSITLLTMKRMISLWTSFIKFGNPTRMENESLLELKGTWSAVSSGGEHHLKIDTNLEMSETIPRMNFWKKMEEKYSQRELKKIKRNNKIQPKNHGKNHKKKKLKMSECPSNTKSFSTAHPLHEEHVRKIKEIHSEVLD